jgi:excisionase family DNA binding protein
MNSTRRLGLTTSEAARHLGVSLSTVRRWSDLGHLPGYRTPGGQRRFSREQLDAFIASLEGGAGDDPPRGEALRPVAEPPQEDDAPAAEAGPVPLRPEAPDPGDEGPAAA